MKITQEPPLTMQLPDSRLTRRAFFRKTVPIGAIAVLAMHQGCKSESPPLASCQDLSQLSEEEKRIRISLAYVDKTPYPQKRCDNCQFWLASKAGTSCGGCTILKGPIEAEGYCSSWAPPPVNPG